MRCLQSHGKGYGRHSWDIRNRFEAWRRGIGRANLPLVDGVTFGANLLRQGETLSRLAGFLSHHTATREHRRHNDHRPNQVSDTFHIRYSMVS
jgi:hypothetical protein